MSKIAIKIKNGKHSLDQVADNLKVDLREDLSIKKEQPFKRWLFLFVLLLLGGVIFAGIQALFFSNKIAFSHLIPKEAVIFGLIDQTSLYNQTVPFHGFLQENNFYGQDAISKMGDYFKQADLAIQNDIYTLFKKQAAFILMPSNSETPLPFVVIFEKNQPLSKIEQVLSKIEPNLKKDYNFSTENYRQIKMTILKPISFVSTTLSTLYAYAQIDNYFIICNSQQTMEAFIDSIID